MNGDAGSLSLLDPLNEPQQALVEVVGRVFAEEPGTWPIFDHIDAKLEAAGFDARETIVSFPSLVLRNGGYCAVWCESGWNTWPGPNQRVALTAVGVYHCRSLQSLRGVGTISNIDLVQTLFALIEIAVKERRREQSSPIEVRRQEIESGPIIAALVSLGYRFDRMPIPVLPELMARELPFWGGGSSISGDQTTWTNGLSRSVNDFEGVSTIEGYVARLALQQPPPPRPALAAPSPLGLVAALDYLDLAWQLAEGGQLFRQVGFERSAKLAYAAQTPDEFTSRLSALGEILRDARDKLPKPTARNTREHPLKSFEQHLVGKLGADSEARIQTAVHTLENVIHVRDAGQHTDAGRRAAIALGELGVDYPPGSPVATWETIQAQTIEALGAIREELLAHHARQSV